MVHMLHFCSHKCHILALWLLMLKCKQDCIHYKGLLHGISKPNDKKPLLSWFKCMMKKKCWRNLNACKLTNHESFLIHSTLTHGLHFLLLIGLVGFGISIADIPCEFKMFCIFLKVVWKVSGCDSCYLVCILFYFHDGFVMLEGLKCKNSWLVC